jgi:hypothetical protein
MLIKYFLKIHLSVILPSPSQSSNQAFSKMSLIKDLYVFYVFTTLIRIAFICFIHSSMALQLCVGPWSIFTLVILYTVGRTSWTGDQAVARPLSTHRTVQTQNKRTQISMPWVGFEPTIPTLERMRTVHASVHAATVIGIYLLAGMHLLILLPFICM